MAAERFIHFLSVTALASGFLCSVSPAFAEGGGADRASMQEGVGRRETIGSVGAVEEKTANLAPPAPLPPRRPRNLEAAFAALQGVPAAAPDAAAPTPVAVQPDTSAQPAVVAHQANPVPENTPGVQSSAPLRPVNADPALAGVAPSPTLQPVYPPQQANNPATGNGKGMASLSAWPTVMEPGHLQNMNPVRESDQGFEDQAIAIVEVGKAVKAPLPPLRPGQPVDGDGQGAETVASAAPPVQSAPASGTSFGSISISQPQPAPQLVAVAEQQPTAQSMLFPGLVPLPPTRPRLLAPPAAANADAEDGTGNVSPGRMKEIETVGYVPPSRGKSRLNHIIGDDPEGANSLRSLISKHAAANGIPYGLADAVVRIESRYNPMARNGPYMGLMQIHPRTAASLGYGGDASGLLNSETNLQYGIKYLAMAYRLAGGDTCGTIMRYQGGHRAVSMTAANRTYCNKVKMILAENHQ